MKKQILGSAVERLGAVFDEDAESVQLLYFSPEIGEPRLSLQFRVTKRGRGLMVTDLVKSGKATTPEARHCLKLL